MSKKTNDYYYLLRVTEQFRELHKELEIRYDKLTDQYNQLSYKYDQIEKQYRCLLDLYTAHLYCPGSENYFKAKEEFDKLSS